MAWLPGSVHGVVVQMTAKAFSGAVARPKALAIEVVSAAAKATSIARRLSSLRRFYALQLLQGTLRADPTVRVRAPK